MLTITLDEQGDFEDLRNKLNEEPVFIGGIIYDDEDWNEEFEKEQLRLEAYLQNVCESVGARYPRDLHYEALENGGNNSSSVRLVKKKMGETLQEFLQNGTWNGNYIAGKRRGTYYIFVMLRGKDGKKKLLGKNVSQAVKEDFASNLYVHMAEDVIERLMFHNPVISDIKKVRLDLATRRAVLCGEELKNKREEYERLGYRQIEREHRNLNQAEYLLTNPDNYRTAIEREMLDTGETDILIDRMGVRSIYYKAKKTNMVFLYLADAICSYLSFGIGKEQERWVEVFEKRASAINPDVENLIFAYDDVDDYFKRAWKCLEDGDYYKALSTAYDGSVLESKAAHFYKGKWFPKIVDRMRESKDADVCALAFKKLHESAKNHNINQEKLLYIYENLEYVSNQIRFPNKKDEAEFYDLYDIGITAYAHVGNCTKAIECYEKCKRYVTYIPLEHFLRTKNKIVVVMCDNLEFRKALEIANESVKLQRRLTEVREDCLNENCVKPLEYAISLSQRGQVYSYLEDERAESDFLCALEMMDEETPDYLITQSYLLHFYIEQKNKEKYDQCAKTYFCGKEELTEQFQVLVTEGAKGKNARFSLKFALYIFIKAAYTFYLDELPQALVIQLKDIEKSLQSICPNAKMQINGHPWEIIYKYLALIMLKYREPQLASGYIKKIEMGMKNQGKIIDLIVEQGRAEYETAIGKREPVENGLTYMYR